MKKLAYRMTKNDGKGMRISAEDDGKQIRRFRYSVPNGIGTEYYIVNVIAFCWTVQLLREVH